MNINELGYSDLKTIQKMIEQTFKEMVSSQQLLGRVSGISQANTAIDVNAQIQLIGDTTTITIPNKSGKALSIGDIVYIDLVNNDYTNAFVSYKR